MNFLEISLLVTLSASFAVVCIYCYLYFQYRQLYIFLWIISWIPHFTRLFFFPTPLPELTLSWLIPYQITAIFCSLTMLVATSMFVESQLSKLWYLGAIVSALITDICLILKISFLYSTLPTCFYLCLVYCQNGILLIKHIKIKGLGKYITGISFIILGLHILDLPFLITVQQIAPWGLLLDAGLRFLIAIGMLVLYLEKSQDDLVIKERHYRLLAENASDVIYRFKFKPIRSLEYISPSTVKLTGYHPERFYASPRLILSLVHPNDRPYIKVLYNELSSRNTNLLTLRIVKPDGSIIWIEQNSVPIFNDENICIGFEGIVRDITTRKSLEQDLSRLDRLNAIGQMAASVAHEIRNPMTTVRGYLQFFSNKNEFSNYKKQFTLLIDELDRTNQIIKEYLSLSQHRSIELESMQLNEIIEALYPLINADAVATNKEVKLNLKPTSNLYLDQKEIRQLILNLVRNGLEAMKPGNYITIHTYNEGHEVVLGIQDNGPGIPADILEHIGKPFMTTKDTGTGLGLAICYRIANRHQAKITVDSSTSGTTFLIRFKIPSETNNTP